MVRKLPTTATKVKEILCRDGDRLAISDTTSGIYKGYSQLEDGHWLMVAAIA
jgi:hypothetical protein